MDKIRIRMVRASNALVHKYGIKILNNVNAKKITIDIVKVIVLIAQTHHSLLRN